MSEPICSTSPALFCVCVCVFLSQESNQGKFSGNQQQHHRESDVYQQDDV